MRKDVQKIGSLQMEGVNVCLIGTLKQDAIEDKLEGTQAK